MFSDGFASFPSSTTAVVSELGPVDVASTTLAQACTGVLATGGACIPTSGTFASDFTLANPISVQLVYAYNGFLFTVTALSGAITRTALTCGASTCNDALAFTGTGTVTGPAGFDPGVFSMMWTAQGSCARSPTGALACAAGTQTGSWQALVSTVPEPGTVALFGMAILALALVRRPNGR
ncbi:MAG TPA: PEP-CTERM sorting domain-containing protein [Casimicrobiaceae bacterium]|jgi:hypothetical protein